MLIGVGVSFERVVWWDSREEVCMDRRAFAVSIGALIASACRERTAPQKQSNARPQTTRADLLFVTREGCVNTPDMLLNLDDALCALHWPLDYQVVDLKTLRPTDPRV